jgi:hypothetical protein
VAPAPREQARPHHFVRGEEGEHVVERLSGRAPMRSPWTLFFLSRRSRDITSSRLRAP